MAQGVIVNVEDKFNNPIEHVCCKYSGGSCQYTDSNGVATVYTYPGTIKIYISRYGFVSDSQYVTIGGGYFPSLYFTPSTNHEIHASIEGIVHNSDDNLIGNMMIWGMGILGNTKYWGCVSESNGQYRLPIHSAGNYTIYCGKNNHDMVSVGNYEQSSTAPVSTTTMNFTGDYTTQRISVINPKLCIDNRSIIIKDDLDDTYDNQADTPTNNVYAKVRKWNGSLLNTYGWHTNDTLSRDGYGGSQYD